MKAKSVAKFIKQNNKSTGPDPAGFHKDPSILVDILKPIKTLQYADDIIIFNCHQDVVSFEFILEWALRIFFQVETSR